MSQTKSVTGDYTITGTGSFKSGFGEAVFNAPPFVPGFQERIGVYVLDNHTIFDEDRIANIGTNTFIWETDTANSSALTAAVGTDLLTGGYTLATGGTDGHQTAIATAGTPFTCVANKPWWIKTRFNLNDHDGVEFFFGLTERAADVDSWHLTAAVGTDLLTGGYTLATGGTGGHQTAIATAGTPFTCVANKPWWIKTRFNLNDHDGVEFFFGLTERAANVDTWHLSAAGAGADRVGFVKGVHNDDAITFAATKNTGGTVSTALDTAQTYDADLSVLSLGIHWDGTAIKFYANKVATTATPGDMALVHTYTTAAGIPDDSNMRLCLLVETGTGAVSTARIEYIKGAYTK